VSRGLRDDDVIAAVLSTSVGRGLTKTSADKWSSVVGATSDRVLCPRLEAGQCAGLTHTRRLMDVS